MRKIWKAGTMLVASMALVSYSVISFADVTKPTVKKASAANARLASKPKVKIKAKAKKHVAHVSHTSTRVHRTLHASEGTGALQLQSSAVLVFDEQAAKPLFAKNSTTTQSIASITKLMTAMVVLDAKLPMDEMITVENSDVDTLRGSSSRLAVGTTLNRGEMLRLALMSSENRAASSLARTYPGGTPAFVTAMNHKAVTLGMQHTHFVDSSGLHAENVSTAEDLVKMVTAGYRYETIREYTTTVAHDVEVGSTRRSLAFKNTNALVKDKEWDIGLSKTGFITEAGRCLVMQVNIASKPVIIVLLDSIGKYTRIGDANRIKKWVENTNGGRVAKAIKGSNDV